MFYKGVITYYKIDVCSLRKATAFNKNVIKKKWTHLSTSVIEVERATDERIDNISFRADSN